MMPWGPQNKLPAILVASGLASLNNLLISEKEVFFKLLSIFLLEFPSVCINFLIYPLLLRHPTGLFDDFCVTNPQYVVLVKDIR